jgi:hypothetical protein
VITSGLSKKLAEETARTFATETSEPEVSLTRSLFFLYPRGRLQVYVSQPKLKANNVFFVCSEFGIGCRVVTVHLLNVLFKNSFAMTFLKSACCLQ